MVATDTLLRRGYDVYICFSDGLVFKEEINRVLVWDAPFEIVVVISKGVAAPCVVARIAMTISDHIGTQ